MEDKPHEVLLQKDGKADPPAYGTFEHIGKQKGKEMNSKDSEKKKNVNPRQNANSFSSATFLWILPVLRKSQNYFESLDTVYEPLEEDSAELLGDKMEKAWLKEIEESKKKKRSPSLIKLFFKLHIKDLIVSGIMIFIVEFIFRLLTPVCLIEFIKYFDGKKKNEVPKEIFYASAAGLVLSPFVTVFINHAYHLKVFHIGMKLRVAISSLIYRKVLKLNRSALNEISTGHIINLLSNDAGRFDFIGSFFFDIWIGPLQTLIVAYCLWMIVGVSCLVGIAVIILSIPLNVWLGKRISIMRLNTALRTDDRVRIMSEIIAGIQVIKMYVWEKPFEKLVEIIRRKEVAVIKKLSYVRGVLNSFPMFHTRLAVFITLITYVLMGNTVTASKAFVLTSFFNVLQLTVADYFPQGASQVAEFFISVKRIENFLLNGVNINKTDQGGKKKLSTTSITKNYIEDNKIGVQLENISAKWTCEGKQILDNVSLELKPGELTAVVGPVGAGKTSLLHAILKELVIDSGYLQVFGKVSYASQEPWLFPASIKQNILFGEEYNEEKFKKVMKACALDKDIEGFIYRERTLVGERGVTLSGGQKARISLARAIYKDADIYLLDDPLSAVDANVQKHLFEKCITGILSDKVVLLITHQVQYLENVKQVVAMENGSIKCRGSYEYLLEHGIDLSKYLRKSDGETEPDNYSAFPAKLTKKDVQPNAVEENEDEEVMKVEDVSNKNMNLNIFWCYFKQGGNFCVLGTLLIIFLGAQVAASGGDYWTSYWVNLEDHIYIYNHTKTASSIVDIVNNYPSREICLYIFTALILANIILSLLRSSFFFSVCMRISQKLHNKMFTSVSRSPMLFFNENPSGRILNRFSKDIGNIDEILPTSMISCLQIFLSAVGVFSVVPSTNVWLLVPTFAMICIFYLMRQFYLASSCLIKRVEGAARSPVYTHLSSSLQGLTTVHALGAEAVLTREFDNHQDKHSATWYTFIAAGRAISLWLDLVCALYNALVTMSFVVIKTSAFGGNVGLAITQTTALTSNLQWGMRQSAEVENHMTSVERILEYTQLKEEEPLMSLPDKKPQAEWPMKGKISFRSVFLRYNPDSPWVLNDLSFTILPTQKVGVVGRTGAGKSSIISALFRLFEVKGSIEIDNIDTSTIGLWDMRSKISVIPQDPVLFTGSLRYNLDPFNEVSDDVLWQALEEVELKEYVKGLKEGLNSTIHEGGSNLSMGQRQLISLARAIVRGNKILILDEPTANVDSRTDAFIQEAIRKKFKDCTVLTIAHRLNSIMDSDLVMVMDFGKLVEFAHPYILLQNKSGYLRELAEQSGCFQELFAVAAQHFSGDSAYN